MKSVVEIHGLGLLGIEHHGKNDPSDDQGSHGTDGEQNPSIQGEGRKEGGFITKDLFNDVSDSDFQRAVGRFFWSFHWGKPLVISGWYCEPDRRTSCVFTYCHPPFVKKKTNNIGPVNPSPTPLGKGESPSFLHTILW
jgi:hypothetical protein